MRNDVRSAMITLRERESTVTQRQRYAEQAYGEGTLDHDQSALNHVCSTLIISPGLGYSSSFSCDSIDCIRFVYLVFFLEPFSGLIDKLCAYDELSVCRWV